MHTVRFWLFISPDELLRYYRGQARTVTVTAEDGQRVQFPASALRPFVTKDGISGRFSLRFDHNNRLAGLVRLAS